MAYHVEFGKVDDTGKPVPVGIDFGAPGKPLTVALALEVARQMILEGKPNVSIEDGTGRSISGYDLLACCQGKKKLTDDLRAISN